MSATSKAPTDESRSLAGSVLAHGPARAIRTASSSRHTDREIPRSARALAVSLVALIPVLTGRSRQFEATVIAALQRAAGIAHSRAIGDGKVLAIGKEAVVAKVTASCSGLPLSLVMGAVAIAVSGPTWRRRLRNAFLAFSVVYVLNLVRVAITVYLGAQLGRSPMVVFHDWAGTGMTIAGGVTSVLFLIIAIDDRSRDGSSQGARLSPAIRP